FDQALKSLPRCGTPRSRRRWIRGGSVEHIYIEPGKNGRGRRRSSCCTTAARNLALAACDGDVLLSVQHERDRRSHSARLPRRDIEKLISLIRTESPKMSIAQTLKNEISRCGHGSAADTASAHRTPLFFLSHHVPRD